MSSTDAKIKRLSLLSGQPSDDIGLENRQAGRDGPNDWPRLLNLACRHGVRNGTSTCGCHDADQPPIWIVRADGHDQAGIDLGHGATLQHDIWNVNTNLGG